MARTTIRLGTRGSDLALAQTQIVIAALQVAHPDAKFIPVVIKTTGDRLQGAEALRKAGTGVFVKELERALLSRKIDAAVHSLKDVPTTLPKGLILGAILEREEAGDAFVGRGSVLMDRLMPGSVIGTSSLRRQAFLRSDFPYLRVDEMRGNLDSRLAKLLDPKIKLAGIIVAAAGLKRLRPDLAFEVLPKSTFVPAAGQGALCIEIRESNAAMKKFLAPIHHVPTAIAVAAERDLQSRLEAGCQAPLGVHAETGDDGLLKMVAAVAMPDGKNKIRAEATGTVESPQEVTGALETILRTRGADEVLAAMRGTRGRKGSSNGHNGHKKPARKPARRR